MQSVSKQGGLWEHLTACVPPSNYVYFVFYAVRIVTRRLVRSPYCVSPSRQFFVFYAVRIVTRRIMGSPYCLCPSRQFFRFLCSPYRNKEAREITLLSVCPSRKFFCSYAVLIVTRRLMRSPCWDLRDSQTRESAIRIHESRRTWNQEWLYWRGRAAIYPTDRPADLGVSPTHLIFSFYMRSVSGSKESGRLVLPRTSCLILD
jgi:hypothetical protein